VFELNEISGIFRGIDVAPAGSSPEALVDNLVRSSLLHVPGLSVAMNLPPSDHFRRGGRGEGDVVGVDNTGQTESFVEVKSSLARVSWGAVCPARCGAKISQFAHMAHVGVPIVVVTTTTRRASHEAAWRDEGLVSSARVLTFDDVADLIHGCLIASGSFDNAPFLHSYFSVALEVAV